jgi:hypothetical protein
MRIIFVVLIASVLSILAFKYMDRSIGESQLMASPTELSARSSSTLPAVPGQEPQVISNPS